jgi:tellurite methyltransferase
MAMNRSIHFFDEQFRRQVAAGEFALNPFERAALPHVHGRTLDLGCGLGNLAVAAARAGAQVMALDASPAAIERITAIAGRERLAIDARVADLQEYRISGSFDTVVSIGLVMFFPQDRAWEMVGRICNAVTTGGTVILNVLVEGTTYLDMFEPGHFHLFDPLKLAQRFEGWDSILMQRDSFDAAGGTKKEFLTLIARNTR